MNRRESARARGSAWLSGIMLMLAGVAAAAAAPADEATIANDLYRRGNVVGALPYYERLASRDSTSALYAERLAWGLVASFEVLPAGPERDGLIRRARVEAERARLLGSNSNLLQTMLARLNDPAVHTPSEEALRLRMAEAAFTRGDYDTALAGYMEVARDDPRSYAAHLFIGDIHYLRGDAAQAGEWFGKAIAIDPDRETAYRYWADAVAKSGDEEGSLPLYLKAIVAEPYQRNPWMGLRQWADRNGHRLHQPALPVPTVGFKEGESGKDAQVQIGIDPSVMADPRIGAAWLAYATNRAAWLKGRYLERHPGATTYRHSLQEEIESFGMALAVLERAPKQIAEEPVPVQNLRRLAADGMLEAYVLLNAVDEGIAQDYPAYRQQNRDRLAAYIEKHMIGRDLALK